MSVAPASIAVSALGCLCTVGILGYAATWKVSGFLLVIAALTAGPYLLCCLFARALRTHRRASAWVLVGALATAAVGVGLPALTFFGPTTDAQGGLIFLVLPFYEGLACAPFLWAAARAAKDRNPAA